MPGAERAPLASILGREKKQGWGEGRGWHPGEPGVRAAAPRALQGVPNGWESSCGSALGFHLQSYTSRFSPISCDGNLFTWG